jgi:HAD superfamily hydrolase (TIGR01509 family)
MSQQTPAGAVIFDFDGVVLLSEPFHMAAWTKLAQEIMCPLPEGFLERGLGTSDEDLSQELAQCWRSEQVSYDWILNKKRAYYQDSLKETMVMVPGVLAAIKHLHGKLPLALATSSCRLDIEPVIEKYHLRRYFSVILTVEDVQKPKPDPEIYLKAAARLSVSPQQCWVFEDSFSGITAAQKAGMNIIAVTTAYPVHELPRVAGYIPDFVALDHIADMLQLQY